MRKSSPQLKRSERCDHHRGCWCFVNLSPLQSPLPTPLLSHPPPPSSPLQSVAAQEKLSAELDELREQIVSISNDREEHEKVAKSVEDKVCAARATATSTGLYLLAQGLLN